MYFQPQPDTDSYWIQNNGTPAGTIYTYTTGGNTYNRDGMKTFAATDIAYGQRLDSVKMEFDYFTGTDPTTGKPITFNPNINFAITDGNGNHAMWSPGTGGTPYTTADIVGEPGWKRLTLDCTTLADNTWGQMNEYNGGVSTNRPMWSVIQGWTIAGFYDYLAAPLGGYGAWNETLWGDMTNVGGSDPTPNKFGVIVFYGDTVGGMIEDGNGEIGDAANRAYGQAGRLMKNYHLTVGGTMYDMTFAPEPGFVGLLGLAALGLRRRAR